MRKRQAWTAFGALLLSLVPTVPAHPASFAIQPGRGIGPVALGMTPGQVMKALEGRMPSGDQAATQILQFPSHGLTVWIRASRVVKIQTTNPMHRTVSGFGPGEENWPAVRQALCHRGVSEASASYSTPTGLEIRCPLQGVVIEVSGGRVASFIIVPVQRLRDRRQPLPTRR